MGREKRSHGAKSLRSLTYIPNYNIINCEVGGKRVKLKLDMEFSFLGFIVSFVVAGGSLKKDMLKTFILFISIS